MSKVPELVSKAKEFLKKPRAEQSEDCWHAYVCIEYAILDLKLANKIEAAPPVRPKRKKMTPTERLEVARKKLDELRLDQAPRELLQSLRDCREPLKELVANYDRTGLRSTTS